MYWNTTHWDNHWYLEFNLSSSANAFFYYKINYKRSIYNLSQDSLPIDWKRGKFSRKLLLNYSSSNISIEIDLNPIREITDIEGVILGVNWVLTNEVPDYRYA